MVDPEHPVPVDDRVLTVTTSRLQLRRFREGDAETFAAYRSDPDVARYQGWEAPVPLADARRLVASFASEPFGRLGDWVQVAIADRATDALVGDVALRMAPHEPRLVTFGVTLGRDWQGRGLATEVLRAVIDHLMRHGAHRVSADCDPDNRPVVALLERLGMRREAHHRASYPTRDGWTDEYVYAILADEWLDATPRQRPEGSSGTSTA